MKEDAANDAWRGSAHMLAGLFSGDRERPVSTLSLFSTEKFIKEKFGRH